MCSRCNRQTMQRILLDSLLSLRSIHLSQQIIIKTKMFCFEYYYYFQQTVWFQIIMTHWTIFFILLTKNRNRKQKFSSPKEFVRVTKIEAKCIFDIVAFVSQQLSQTTKTMIILYINHNNQLTNQETFERSLDAIEQDRSASASCHTTCETKLPNEI